MILFLGDSFTWGQGLEWEWLINNENWSIEDINKIIPPKHACERLPIHLQDYREKNRWPRLVSEHFNHQYDLGRCGNGGGNLDAYLVLDNLESFIYADNLDMVIFQTTNSHRNYEKGYNGDYSNLFSDEIMLLKSAINSCVKLNKNIKFLTLSWLPEVAQSIENEFGEKMVVKFNFENVNYNSFEPFLGKISLGEKYQGLNDAHFNLEGNEFIAKSVIDHIEKYDLFQQNIRLI